MCSDATNYYFETDIDDSFRKRGLRQEHRPNPIVQMGLFIDTNGVPISYELFEGNKTDPLTYIPAIEQVKKQFRIEKVVTVADKAMNSIRNITDAHKKGDGYLFSSKFRGKRGSRKDIQEFVLDKSGWEYSKDMKNAKKSTILTRKLENGEIVKEKVVVTWKQKYAIRESIRRDGAIDYVRNMRPSEMKRVLIGRNETKYYDVKVVDEKTGENINLSPHIHIDQELVDFDARSDGFNVITTSEIHMTDKEIIAAYGQLNRIEDCFKVTKTNLKARSVFVWTKEHIEAHFLTCFIALVIVKLLYYKLDSKYSIRRIIDALRSANVAYIAQGYYTNLTPEINIEILKELGLELETSILKTEQINKIMK